MTPTPQNNAADGPVELPPLLREVDEACHGYLRRLGESLDEEVWTAVAQVLREARDAHADVMSAQGLPGDCPEDAQEVRTRAAAYVEAVAEKVQAPLLTGLRSDAPGRGVVEAFNRSARQSRASTAALPALAEVTWRPDQLAAAPFDGMRRRLGRFVARVLSSVGVAGATRDVRPRAVAARHRALHLAAGEARWRNEALRSWGGWLARLEVGWAAWVSAVFPGLTSLLVEDEDTGSDFWDELSEAAAALDALFRSLLEASPHGNLTEMMRVDLKRWSAVLASDMSVAGTFMLDPRGEVEAPKQKDAVEGWSGFEGQVLDRMSLHQKLLRVFAAGARTCEELSGRLEGEALSDWAEDIRACAERLRAAAAPVRDGSVVSPELLARVRADAEEALAGATTACPTASELEGLARRAAGLTIGAVQARLREVPDSLSVHPLVTPPLRRPPTGAQTVDLQEMARQAFDALRMERIRTAPGVLVETVPAMNTRLSDVSEIVAFGFDAASVELSGDADDPSARARELVVDGLERAAQAVETVPAPLAQAIDGVGGNVSDEVMRGVGALANRALADRLQGQLMDAPSRLREIWAGAKRRFGPDLRRETQRLRFLWLRLRRATGRLLRRGRSLVGAQGTEPSAAARTARSLAHADEVAESLPLVYQHLFAAEPVTDPGLLTGRDMELEGVRRRWEQWRVGKGIPLLVTGRRGYGISSFFNVFLAQVGQEDVRVEFRELDRRLTDEAALAAYLADLFGFQEEITLDGLATRMLKEPEGALPDMVALEGLEHVYLRVPGGTDLLERLFTLMAETEPRIFWVGSLTSSAWQVVRKAEPAAAVQMDCLELEALEAGALEAALMHRHRRSGLNVEFEEPAEGRRLLRRRLRNLRGTDRHQELLRTDFFERLHRAANGNLRLALFLWLRSVDLSGSANDLVVHPLRALDWSFLDALDLTQSFTIKAFLEHNTLTLAEHDRIFRVTRQESYHVFESLLNRQIIEVVPASDEADSTVSRVVGETRYRIRPLLTGAVATHLASRNIVH